MGLDTASLVIHAGRCRASGPSRCSAEGLALGESAPVAMRKTALLLDIDEAGLEVLGGRGWGDDLGILEYGENGEQAARP